MLIKSIALENFLPFQGRQLVEFSTDPEHNVTLIMGDNGAGKTSLAQAFEWCLYGRFPEGYSQVINNEIRDQIRPGSYSDVIVEISLLKANVNYKVRRQQRYSRPKNGGKVKSGSIELSISFKENGETKYIPDDELRFTINKLLAEDLSHYFFFDGEHVKNMRNEIEHGKSSDFASAVKAILGFQSIASALGHLKSKGNKTSVQKWFRDKKVSSGDFDAEACRRRIAFNNTQIEAEERSLEIAIADKKAAEEQITDYEQKLRENQDSAEAQHQVDEARSDVEKNKRDLEVKQDKFFKTFRNGYKRFFIDRPIHDAKDALKEDDKIDKGVPYVNAKTIEFLLKRQRCICGRELEFNSDAYRELTDLLNYVPPKDLGTYISEFTNNCDLMAATSNTLYDDLGDAYREYCDSSDNLKRATYTLEIAQARLDNLDYVDVASLNNKLTVAKNNQELALRRATTAENNISVYKSRNKNLQDEIDKAAVKNRENEEIDHCLAYVDYIYDYLSSFYESKERETRAKLQERVNIFLSQMYEGQLRLELDENYGVTVQVDGINMEESIEEWKTSSGQTLAIILAFILGILDIAKENIGHGETLLAGDTYPLVMDAPLSDFDKTRIGTICNLLPTVAEQVVIIIKDTDGELAEKHLRSRIKRRYTIKKITDYESYIEEDD